MNNLTPGTTVVINETNQTGKVIGASGYGVAVQLDSGEVISFLPEEITPKSFLTEGQ